MKIAYFSPLFPLKSGISEYSERELLPYLKKYCDIDVIIDKGYKPNSEFVKNNFKVVDYENFENNYDCILYHMGNNPYHEYMYEAAIKNSGVVVLHDPFLHHLVRHLTIGNKDRRRYIEIMQYCLGIKGKAIAEQAIATRQFPLFEYPVIKELVDSSLAVIVHSVFAEKTVKEESPDVLVQKIKMPITIPQDDEKNIREKLNIPKDFTVIGTFGNVGFYKRLNVCLKSFSHYLKKNPKSVFVIVGSYLNEKYSKEVHDLIKELRISENVIETGYVDDLFPYVAASDIVVQLRYPTAGETSIITLQIMGMGKPVIVSNIGSFTELPDDSVIKIEPDVSEEVALYNSILKLTDDKSFSKTLSENAKKYIESEHNPENIAKSFSEFLAKVPKTMPQKLVIEKSVEGEKEFERSQSLSDETTETPEITEIKMQKPYSEDEVNVSEIDLKKLSSSRGILKGIRSILHKEIRDWIVFPFQKKQTTFNRKTADNISNIYSNIEKIQSDLIKSIQSYEKRMQENEKRIESHEKRMETLRKLVGKDSLENDEKIQELIRFNLARRIDSLIEEKFTTLREIFEIENKVKQSFLDIKKRSPTEGELRTYVNKIKKNEITLKDLENELK